MLLSIALFSCIVFALEFPPWMEKHINQHVLASTTYRHSTIHDDKTTTYYVTVQPTGVARQNGPASIPTTGTASASAASVTGDLSTCYPKVDGQPDWTQPCRARQKWILECQFTGSSAVSDEEWSKLWHADQEPPSVSNARQQQCLCSSYDFWEDTRTCGDCLNSIGMHQNTDKSAMSIVSSGFCAQSQTALIDEYLSSATFTTTKGAPSVTTSGFVKLGTTAGFVTNNASSLMSLTAGVLTSSGRFSQDMPGWNPSSTLSSTIMGTAASTSVIRTPASTTKYLVGTPTVADVGLATTPSTSHGSSTSSASTLSTSFRSIGAIGICLVVIMWSL